MKNKLLVLLFLLFAVPVSVAFGAEEFGSLTPQEVAARLHEKNFFVFDNNNYERFQKGHVAGAKWLNPYAVKATDLPSDKTVTLVFYCANEH